MQSVIYVEGQKHCMIINNCNSFQFNSLMSGYHYIIHIRKIQELRDLLPCLLLKWIENYNFKMLIFSIIKI